MGRPITLLSKSYMNKAEKIFYASLIVASAAAACNGTGSNAAESQGQAETGVAGTLAGMPDPSETPSATATLTPTSTPDFPTPTVVYANIEQTFLNNFLLTNPDSLISDYPAWVNASTDESSGVASTTIEKVREYFNNRDQAVSNPSIEALDRMFGQLSLPVNPDVFKDRSLNHDWTGYGMGFDSFNLNTLKPLEELQALQAAGEPIGTIGAPYSRAWTLTNARNIDAAVLLMVREFINLNPQFANQEQTLFDQITKGDMGIKEQPDDNDPFTINDQFTACETYSAPAATRSLQSETARQVQFNPEQEVMNDGLEQETTPVHDSDNSMLVAMVTDGNVLWIEARDLSSPPDPLNAPLDSNFDGRNPGRWHGGRLVPCGGGEFVFTPTPTPTPTTGFTPSIPEISPTPQPPQETPVPTNPHQISTATSGPPPTRQPTATDIP